MADVRGLSLLTPPGEGGAGKPARFRSKEEGGAALVGCEESRGIWMAG